MSRVVLSQIVEVIDKMFPRFRDQEPNDKRTLTANHRSSLAAVSYLVEQLPDELIVLGGDNYIEFAASIAAIRQIQETCPGAEDITFDSAEKPSVHPSRASGRTEAQLK